MPFVALTTAYVYFDARAREEVGRRGRARRAARGVRPFDLAFRITCYIHVHERRRDRRAAPEPQQVPSTCRAGRAADRHVTENRLWRSSGRRPPPQPQLDRLVAEGRVARPLRRGLPRRYGSTETRTRSAARSTRSAASAELPIFYADSSALVKLVRDEPESPALRAFFRQCRPRLLRAGARRGAPGDPPSSHDDPRLSLDVLAARAGRSSTPWRCCPSTGLCSRQRGARGACPAGLAAIRRAVAIELSRSTRLSATTNARAAAARLAGLRTVRPDG